MTHVSFEFLCFILFMLGAMTFATTRGLTAHATICTVCLVCAPLLGYPKAAFFGHFGYTGAVFFGVAMFGIALEFIAYGPRAGYSTTGPVTLGLAFVFGAGYFLEHAGVLTPAYNDGIQIPLARLCSAALLQPLFVYALRRRMTGPQLPRVLGLNCLVLICDAVLFFPLAFQGAMTGPEIIEQTLVSVAMRMEVFVASIPFLVGFIWLQRKGFVPPAERLADMI